jgi:hypothetical protein
MHCGGESIKESSVSYPYEAEGPDDCKDVCSSDIPGCTSFVWRASDKKCFWKSGVSGETLVVGNVDGLDCYSTVPLPDSGMIYRWAGERLQTGLHASDLVPFSIPDTSYSIFNTKTQCLCLYLRSRVRFRGARSQQHHNYTDGYYKIDTMNCGGEKLKPLNDDISYPWTGTIEECKSFCDADDNCNAFTRRSSDNMCFWNGGVSKHTMYVGNVPDDLACWSTVYEAEKIKQDNGLTLTPTPRQRVRTHAIASRARARVRLRDSTEKATHHKCQMPCGVPCAVSQISSRLLKLDHTPLFQMGTTKAAA